MWLGLDACAGIAAIAVALAIGGYVIRRRESNSGAPSRSLRAFAWLVGAGAVVAPIAAYASGSRPADARDALPLESSTIATMTGIVGGLAAPAGRYEVVAHEGTSITGHITAGGEPFDARFSDIHGFWAGDPRDLTEPMTADVSVAAASVDTGVRSRSRHARSYLHVDAYPRIELRLDRVLAARRAGAGVEFNARGTLTLIGRTHSIVITGTLERPNDAALARLGLTGSVLLVKATFSIAIKDTALAANAKAFDGDVIPIGVSLVLSRTGI